MKKGDRVVILRGRTSRGMQGTVIWYGDDRFDEEGLRKRVGIRIEGQAEPVYVNAAHVEVLEAAADPAAATPEKAAAKRARAKAPRKAPALANAEGRNLELERALLEDPDDRSRYAVYGDWLQERGDPRGELIAAQLAADEDARHAPHAKELLAAYEQAMRERIPVLRKKSGALPQPFTWRWGFVEVMKVYDVHLGALEALLAEPELAVVQALDLATTCSRLKDLSRLAGARSLRRLNLSYNPIEDLAPLNALEQLRTLRCWTRSLGELADLRGCRHLEILELDETRLREVGNLAGLESLAELGLAKTSLLDVASFPRLPRLKKLSLSKTVVKDLGPLVTQLPALEVLCLSNTLVSELDRIAELSSLKVLELDSTKVTDLSPLAALGNLERLNLALTEVRDLSPILALPGLKELYLAKAPVPAAQIAALKQRPGIKVDTKYTFR